MDFSFKRKMSVLAVFIFLQCICLIFPVSGFALLHGLEVEFASEKILESDSERIPGSYYKKPLELVRQIFKDPNGEIELKKWNRFSNLNAKHAVYRDPLGRKWQVVPEAVNTPGLDGFEFVTPPIEGDEDHQIIYSVLNQIQEGGLYGKGLRSSVHVTINAAHLISKNGDASHLIDTILFIENHWPEIYAAVSPKRYGTIVNRFSVPLAAEQKTLLTELGQLSQEQRTYNNVKALFEKYNGEELRLKLGMRRYMWKYRAANYRKLFALAGEKYLPVIEFRILDFMPTKDIARLVDLFLSIMEKGYQIEPKSRFVDPFPEIQGVKRTDPLNRALFYSDSVRYENFIRGLGFDVSEYPRYKTYTASPFVEIPVQVVQKAYSRFNPEKPYLYDEKPITFGFELELLKNHTSEVVTDVERKKLRLDRFPFLDGSVDEEDSGNIEVRSKPTEVLSEAVQQMKELRKVVKEGVASFHLHMRVPIGLANRISTKEQEGWFSRISDAIYGWRVQYRNDIFAFRASTQVRRSPYALENKGTLTVKTIGDTLDIEFRGFMESIEQIQSFAELVIVGLLNPELVQGFTDFQLLLHYQKKDLIEVISDFIEKYQQRKLNKEEYYLLMDLSQFATKNGIMPLFGFEFSPVFSELDRIKIEDANFEFQQDVVALIEDVTKYKKFERQSDEFYQEFRSLIKRWAKSIRFFETLKSTLLMYDVDSRMLNQNETFINKMIAASVNTCLFYPISQAANLLLKNLPMDLFFKSLTQVLRHSDPIVRRQAITLLTELVLERVEEDRERKERAARLLMQLIQQALSNVEEPSFEGYDEYCKDYFYKKK